MLLGILLTQHQTLGAEPTASPALSAAVTNAAAGSSSTNGTNAPGAEVKADARKDSLPLMIRAARMLKADPNPNPYALRALTDLQKSISALGAASPAEAIPGSEIKGWTRKELYVHVQKDLEKASEAFSPGDPGAEDLISAISQMDKAVFLCGA